MKKGIVRETFKNLKRTFKYAKGERKQFILFLLFSSLVSVAGAVFPVLSAQIVVNMTNSIFIKVIIVGIAIFFVQNIRNISHFFTNKCSQLFLRKTLLEMNVDVAEKVTKLKMKEIEGKSSGLFIDRISNDSNSMITILLNLNVYITEIIANIGVLFAIFIISKVMFLYIIISMFILYMVEKVRMNLYYKQDKKYRKLREDNVGLVGELVRGIKDIKVLNIDKNFIKKTRKKIENANNERFKMANNSNKFRLLSDSIQEIFILIFLFLGVILVTKNMLSPSNFVVLFMYQDRIYYNLLFYITNLIDELKNFNLSAERVYEVIDDNSMEKESFGNKKLSKAKGNIEFKNVSFSYNEKENVLNNLSLKIKANETVAIVGKSGSGKSTILSLISKLYEVKSGEVTIDDININDLDKNSIRGNISIITQSPYIFNFTIRENFELVKEDLTEEEMIEACKIACLHDYIMNLPDKYDTLLGEGGINLSGGQKQRLAIARAFLKQTEIILFDEATSALDNETQKNIIKAIDNMKGKFTIIIVAHRLSTIKNCDRIILIENGKKITEGTHEELIKNSKEYKNLYESEIER